MAGIEFISPDTDDGDDEELVVEPRARRRRGPLIAAGVAVVAGAITFAVVHSNGGTHPSAAPDTGTNPIAPDQPSGANRPDHLGPTVPAGPTATTAPEGARPGRILALPTVECSSPSGCRVDLSVPPDLVHAVRERFPTVHRVAGRTFITDVDIPNYSVVSRHLTATAGSLHLSIDLHPANDHDDPRRGTSVRGTQRVVYATALRAGLAVVVTVIGPPGRVPSEAVVAGLASDARLALST